MSDFLKKFFVIGIMGAFVLITLFIASKVFLYNTVTIRYEKPLKYVVVGNSHPATAFNDSLIPGFLNASRGGEWYLHSYVKLKRILKDNPTIDTVFVELDELMMYKKTDRLLWQDNSLGVYYNYNSSFFSLDEEWVIIKNNPIGYILNIPMNVRVSWTELFVKGKNLAWSPNIFPIDFSFKSNVDSSLIALELQKPFRPKQEIFNEVNLFYLNKIKALCEGSGIQVVFIRCPVHEAFEGRRYEEQFQEFRAKYFKNDLFLDFKDFNLLDTDFHDLDHLNRHGANRFTVHFKSNI
jgi:hypothetical protein